MCLWSVVCIAGSGCSDSFVRFEHRSATKVIEIPAEANVVSVDQCKSSCLHNADCVGFDWLRDEAVVAGAKRWCVQYDHYVGDTTQAYDFDLYIREKCVPGMYRVQQTKVIHCRFLLLSKSQIGFFTENLRNYFSFTSTRSNCQIMLNYHSI